MPGLQIGKVVAVKDCRVSDYRGVSLNGPFDAKDIKVEDQISHPRYTQLKKWSVSNDATNVESLTQKPNNDGQGRKKEQIYTLAEMKKSAEENDDVTSGTKSAFYMITGIISSILHGEEGNPKPLFYLACPSCKKKVTEDYDAYKCERCDKLYH